MFKLALDAGHGAGTAGKRALRSLDAAETREWQLNDRVCDYIEAALRDWEGCTLLRLDDADDGSGDVPLSARVRRANEWGADLYLSIHHNAGANGTSAGGIVAFSYPAAPEETVAWRDALYDSLAAFTGLRGNRAMPKTTAGFYVLKYTAMPAVLLELGFMDSTSDTPVILSDAYAVQCASAIVHTLVQRVPLQRSAGTGRLYRVQSGAFTQLAQAEARRDALAAAGFEAYIVSS